MGNSSGITESDGFREMDQDEFDAAQARIEARIQAVSDANQKALKHELWACRIGDLLEVTVPFETTDWEETEQSRRNVVQGDLFRAADLKGRGWDLERVSGDGPAELRVMNGNLLGYFKVLPQADTDVDSP